MTKMLARALLAAGTLAIVSAVSAPAEAAYKHRHVTAHRFGHYLAWRHFHHYHRNYQVTHLARKQPGFAALRRASLRITSHHIASSNRPSCFYTARAMGGPCGCVAGAKVLGIVDHVWHGINLWLANDWLRFPHVRPEEANAVVWPGRHVAATVPGTYRDGTVVVEDSWATHRVRTAGLVFVRARKHHSTYAPEAGPTGPRELAFALMPH